GLPAASLFKNCGTSERSKLTLPSSYVAFTPAFSSEALKPSDTCCKDSCGPNRAIATFLVASDAVDRPGKNASAISRNCQIRTFMAVSGIGSNYRYYEHVLNRPSNKLSIGDSAGDP